MCGDYTAAFAEVVAAEKGCAVADLPLGRSWDFDEWGLDALGGFEHLHRLAVLEKRIFRDMPVIDGLRRGALAAVGRRACGSASSPTGWSCTGATRSPSATPWPGSTPHGIPYRDLCFLGRKPEVEADLYVDDAPHNVEALRAAGNEVIVFDQPYNHAVGGLRATTWAEVEEIALERMVASGVPVQPVLPSVTDDHERLRRRTNP